MTSTADRIKKDIAYFRKEAAYNLRKARGWRSLPELKSYYDGRYQALKHASEYIAITLGVAEREEIA
jgi:hypothetical protein